MYLKLTLPADQAEQLNTDAVIEFQQRGGTIGRTRDNDWVLSDPERFVSSHHARVLYYRGSYYIEDTSANGSYLNQTKTPLPKGAPRILTHGDVLYIGNYSIGVEVLDEPSVIIDDIDDANTVIPTVPTHHTPTAPDALAETVVSIAPDALAETIVSTAPDALAETVVSIAPDVLAETIVSAVNAQTQPAINAQLMAAFFTGLGVTPIHTLTTDESAALLQRMGRVITVMSHTMHTLLQQQAAALQELNTPHPAQHNLLFTAPDTAALLQYLLAPPDKTPVEMAVMTAGQAVQQWELALLTVLRQELDAATYARVGQAFITTLANQ